MLLSEQPEDGATHLAVALCLAETGQTAESLGHAQRAVELAPGSGAAYELLASLLVSCSRYEEAVQVAREGLRVSPFSAQLRRALGMALTPTDPAEAVVHYQLALRVKSEWPEVLNNLAWIRATHPLSELRDGSRAVQLAERACELTAYKQAVLVGTLAAAYAEVGRFEDAVAAASNARQLALEGGQAELADRNQTLANLFRAKQPYRDVVKR